MHDWIASARAWLERTWALMLERSSHLSGRALAWGSLALAAVILLSVNLAASMSLRNVKADLTQDRLFTISDGTHRILGAVDEPITVRVYYSRKLGEIAPSYARYFDRVRTLLEQYRDISGGKLELEFQEPEPFSDAEDRAVAAGLRGLRINAEGEVGYFGLVATNATDNQEVIPFLSPDRESFLEYDVTKLVHALSNPKKRVVGVMTALPVDGGTQPMTGQQTPPWLIMDQIREFFDVKIVDQAVKEIPAGLDVLMVAQPNNLTPQAAYAIDQFALKGGKVLVFIDPLAEVAQLQLLAKPGEGRAELAKVLKSWGLDFDQKKVAADIAHARRIQFGRKGPDNMVTEYVSWLALDRKSLDDRDVLSNGIDLLNLASAGFVTKVDGATTSVTPILKTSEDAMEVSVQKVGMAADPVALLREYKPGGKALTLAARVSGAAKTAFPDGAPVEDAAKPADKKPDDTKPDDKKAEADAAKPADAAKDAPPSDAKAGGTLPVETGKETPAAAPTPPPGPGPNHVAAGKINAIVVTDSDLLADQFWVESREFMGQSLVTPSANNAAFVVGALENLAGSDDLIALRGRGVKERHFTLVERIRRDAERTFRQKEQALTQKLANVEQELKKLEASGEGGSLILTDAERQTIERFRGEMLSTRRELRNVKLALRHDIDNLDAWLKFVNIALVPLLIGAAGVGWSVWRARRKPSSS